MIEIKNKTQCCGCEACVNVCPKKCISMVGDNEGFLYPKVNDKVCVNCRKCNKVCPIMHQAEKKPILQAYAVQHKDESIRLTSSSGGIFTGIAEYVLEKNGVVFGVVFDDDFNVIHISTESVDGIEKMRGSKYVQSRIGNNFILVKEYLDAKRMVCFSGTPCQIEGLKSFLGKEYEKLICIDIICFGVPTPKVWNKYKKSLLEKHNSNIASYTFRCKQDGYHDFGTKIVFNNGDVEYTHDKGDEKDFMHVAFYSAMCLRPSCYDCQFKTRERISDLTVFDCWHVENFSKEMEDDKGTTMVFVHSEKGTEIINNISNKYKLCLADAETAIELDGGNLIYSMQVPKKREEFLDEVDELDVEILMKKYFNNNKSGKVIRKIKRILKKMGLFGHLKKIYHDYNARKIRKHYSKD